MTLTLKIIAPSQLPPGQSAEHKFEGNHGSIGRKPNNDFILVDPERYISSNHAQISLSHGNYMITDISTNGVFINNSPTAIGSGNSAEIKSGDKISIGEFELLAEINDAPSITTPTNWPENFAQQQVEPPINTPVDNDPFLGSLVEPQQENQDNIDPLSLLGDPVPTNSFDSQHNQADTPLETPTINPMMDKNEAISIDDIFGSMPDDELNKNASFDTPTPSPLHEPFAAPEFIPDDVDLFGIGGEAQKPDDLIKPHENQPDGDIFSAISSMEENSPPSQSEISPSQPIPAADDLDIFSSLNTAPPTNEATTPPQQVIPESMELPNQQVTNPSLQKHDSGGGISDSQNQLLQAFLAGAGISKKDVECSSDIELMQKVGHLTRIATDGLMTAMRARATIKSNFRVSKTTIAPIENNPIKFLVTTDDALKTLLSDDRKGYMPAIESYAEAFKDLQTHQMALMSGLQATIKAVVSQFNPHRLEQEFDSQAGSSLIPGHKKSKYWDNYNTYYLKLTDLLTDDFQNIYGEDFARAYEEQINKLK